MEHLTITIQSAKEQKEKPDMANMAPIRLLLVGAVIIEKGTDSGRTAVRLDFHDQSGNAFFAMTTGRILANGLAAAIRGAMHRFNDDPDKA